jgi:hypothetical protein
MISVHLTIREAVELVKNSTSDSVFDRVVEALEAACGRLKANLTVKTIDPDKMIPCIKAYRLVTNTGLKEAKDFFDVVRGRYQYGTSYGSDSNYSYVGGTANTVALDYHVAHRLADQLRGLGCEVFVDTYNC